jgi:hypothetical protein
MFLYKGGIIRHWDIPTFKRNLKKLKITYEQRSMTIHSINLKRNKKKLFGFWFESSVRKK